MIDKNTVTMGSDIEAILVTNTGEPFPVCGMVGGTKEKPRSLGGGYFIQEDNVLLEWNIPVARTPKEFVTFVTEGLKRARKEILPSVQMSEQSTYSFHRLYIEGNEQALTFGCEPDYNAWTLEQNPRPCAPDPYLRSAAGHIHIGWENPKEEDQIALIKWADLFVGVPSVIESNDRSRRLLYGKAGSFRPKPYGVEHRVLDNYWIWHGSIVQTIYQRYMMAIDAVNGNREIPPEIAELAQQAINTYNGDSAKQVMKFNQAVAKSFL